MSSTLDIILQGHSAVTAQQTADINIPNLLPASFYDLYCMTKSFADEQMALSIVEKNVKHVSTLCCKSIFVDINTPVILGGTGTDNNLALDAVTLSFDTLPSQYLNISILVPVYVYPDRISLTTSDSDYSTYSISFIPNVTVVGSFPVLVKLSGNSAHEYSVVFKEGISTVTIVGMGSPPVVPKAQSAVFSGDGSYVSISFDSPTNQGRTCILLSI